MKKFCDLTKVLVLSFLCMSMHYGACYAGQDFYGLVEVISGTGSIEKKDPAKISPAVKGDMFYVGEEFSTGEKSVALVNITNGYVRIFVKVEEDTTIKIDSAAFDEDDKVYKIVIGLSKGNIFSEVASKTGQKVNVKINTPQELIILGDKPLRVSADKN